MKEKQVIRNYIDANLLLDRGHLITKIDRDINNRRFLVFEFENNAKLQSDLKEITVERQSKK